MKKTGWISLILIVSLSAYSIRLMSAQQMNQNESSLHNAIQNALTLCYAQEGFYPASLDYLIENYGIVIDENFIVSYQAFASNFRPNFHIYRIGDEK